MEFDSDSDEETQLNEINQLNAVLEADADDISQFSSTLSIGSASSKLLEENCKIQEALALNKLKDEKLRRLEGILVARLRECRQKLKETGSYEEPVDYKDKNFRYIYCGKPYFKGSDNFTPPDNEDTILMAKSQMYDFVNPTPVPGWTYKDKAQFLDILKTMSINFKKAEFNSQISQIQRDCKKNKVKKHIADIRISKIKKQMDVLKMKTLEELALPLDQEYDWDAVAHKSGYRHTPQEYRSLWKLFLHPSINKTPWSKTEHLNLQEIAHNHNLQDWDAIAAELNTGRTGYQCFVYFRTNMSNTFTGQKWTKEEEEYLLRLIDYYKEESYIPWSKITSFMENRTKIQIYNKYLRLTEKRKGRFVPEEDAVLLTCVNKFGVDFRKIAKYLPGRSIAQLRVRYHVLSAGKGSHISHIWTVEEDKKLVQLMANQDIPTNYSILTKHFPGKDRNCIRSRYTTLSKWVRKHPNVDIERAPRRGARRLGHGVASQDLLTAVENLKKKIESEVEVKKKKRVSKDSDHDVIDSAIVAELVNESIREEQYQKAKSLQNDSTEQECTIDNRSSNSTYLCNTLLLLRAHLDMEKFKKTGLGRQYKELTASAPDPALLVKSYSKKGGSVQYVCVEKPDIWGKKVLGTFNYVLPPNYSTITGCRKLMSFLSMKTHVEVPLNLSLMSRRNVLFKKELEKLMDRVTMLFLWPMLLSNVSPNVDNILKSNIQYTNVHKTTAKSPKVLPLDVGLAIPQITKTIINENIDLEESPSEDENTIDLNYNYYSF